MGIFHFLDGERIKVFYRGNTKTSGRCHQGGSQCLGGAIAKECQTQGGQRKDLIEHMKELWNQIGFSPTSFTIPIKEIESDSNNFGGDQEILDLFSFPRQTSCPPLTTPEKAKFSKVRITNFPLELTEKGALEFLTEKVDKSIAGEDIELIKDTRSTQIVLGPGPNK